MLSAALLCGASAWAKVELPSIISDNMVLQQNGTAALWGWTEAGREVKVCASWTDKIVSAVAAEDGKFLVHMPTAAAGGPYTLIFDDGDKTTLENILLGEVWFCGGQSNMEMPVAGFKRQPVEGSAKVIALAKPSRNIRMCTVNRKESNVELQRCVSSGWQTHNPEAVAKTSATAYFFADILEEALGVPVGLLIADYGGSPIEAWMNRETLAGSFQDEFSFAHLEGGTFEGKAHHAPCVLFNGQVAPVVPFTFKGILWYQGCANRNRPEQYSRLQPAYVNMMRQLFDNPDAPFYFVQLAPYRYDDERLFNRGFICEAQAKTLDVVQNCGMVSTLDIGELGTIHPSKKKPVGERLALLALQDTYGFKGYDAHTPRFAGMRIEGSSLVLRFTDSSKGLAPIGVDLEGFEVAGEDRVFHPATGRVQTNSEVVVTCPLVEAPVAVRYGFRNYTVATLFNNFGIPVAPFRTDNWDDIKE